MAEQIIKRNVRKTADVTRVQDYADISRRSSIAIQIHLLHPQPKTSIYLFNMQRIVNPESIISEEFIIIKQDGLFLFRRKVTQEDK